MCDKLCFQNIAKYINNVSFLLQYEPIMYHGQPGIFIPAKRQFASTYAGMRKRAEDIYPYNYGPDGRWGALVAAETEKRNQQEMYERLYHLAQALRGDDRSVEQWKKK